MEEERIKTAFEIEQKWKQLKEFFRRESWDFSYELMKKMEKGFNPLTDDPFT